MRKSCIACIILNLLSVLLLSCNNNITDEGNNNIIDEGSAQVRVTELVNYSLDLSGIKSLGIAKTADIVISKSTNSKKWYGVMTSDENQSEYSTDGLSPIVVGHHI